MATMSEEAACRCCGRGTPVGTAEVNGKTVPACESCMLVPAKVTTAAPRRASGIVSLGAR